MYYRSLLNSLYVDKEIKIFYIIYNLYDESIMIPNPSF